METFYAQKDWKPRTKADHRRAMEMLETWCRENRVPFTVEAINRKRAGQFIGAMASDTTRPLSNQSINKYISALSTYWDWMETRGLAKEENSPWSRQSLPKQKPKEGEEERPFTDEELAKLLAGSPTKPFIKPLMMIGALTGARIDAICSLRVKDITDDGCLRFKKQKKESRSRLVPIHPDLVATLDKLREGKEPNDGLFPECPPIPDDQEAEQSMPAVKAFGAYRIKMGVSDKVEGKRRDRVNFHSFRRWFITKALQADQPLLTVQLIVGHQPQSMAEKKYLGGLTPEQLRTCVEAVKLPSLASPDHPEDDQGQPVVAHDHG